MPTLLYIEASPRKERSASIEVAQTFLDAYREKNPADSIDTLDIWHANLPEFDGDALNAKYAGIRGESLTPEQDAAWKRIRELAGLFHKADKLLLSLPLWNFAIPYKMKQLIDLVTQRNLLFSFENGKFGKLMDGKKAAIIYARGQDYSQDSDSPAYIFDFQRPYTEFWLKFIGFTELSPIFVEDTLSGPEANAKARAEGKKKAKELAQKF